MLPTSSLLRVASTGTCRLGKICISSPEGIPQDLLLRATTLDPSQAAALCACLTKELAVVQGPPGCGMSALMGPCWLMAMPQCLVWTCHSFSLSSKLS